MPSLVEFLNARITEQEIRCRTLLDTHGSLPTTVRRALRVALADCTAKRQIIEVQAPADLPGDEDVSWELMALAFVHSDHPDWARSGVRERERVPRLGDDGGR